MEKAQIRAQVQAAVAAIAADDQAAYSRGVCDKVIRLPEYEEARIIMAYATMKNELDVSRIVRHALGTGKPGKVTLEMARLYNEIIHGRHQEHDEWLTDVYDTPEAAHHALNGLVEKKGQLTS